MLSSNSRYQKTATVTVNLPDGRIGPALKLRTLPATSGEDHAVSDNDQLDVMAFRQTEDGQRFWHIADANTEIEAQQLLRETGATIQVPKS